MNDMPTNEPTGAEILQEIRSMNARVITLENWKISEDAYRAALAQIKSDEAQTKNEGLRTTEAKRRTEMMKQGGIVLGLLAAILYAYAMTHGVKP